MQQQRHRRRAGGRRRRRQPRAQPHATVPTSPTCLNTLAAPDSPWRPPAAPDHTCCRERRPAGFCADPIVPPRKPQCSWSLTSGRGATQIAEPVSERPQRAGPAARRGEGRCRCTHKGDPSSRLPGASSCGAARGPIRHPSAAASLHPLRCTASPHPCPSPGTAHG